MSTNSIFIRRRATGVACLVAGIAGAAHAGRVVIVEGHDPNPDVANAIHVESTQAQINYLARGYTVERLSNASGPVTKADVLQALNDPRNNAFFFDGHGTQMSNGGPFVPGLVLNAGAGAAGILTPADIPAAASARMLHVELQACGQKLPAWDAEFPNAGNVDAWNRAITGAQVWNDIAYHSFSRIPPKGTSRGESGSDRGAPPAKTTDPRFEAAVAATPSHTVNPGISERFDQWTEIGFMLPPPLGAAFGTQSFNIATTDGVSFLTLKGLSVSSGHIVGEVTGGYGAAAFTLNVDATAFSTAMANLDTIPGLRAAGKFTISGNTTGLPENVLLDAAIGSYFGTYALTPPCPGDINGDGHTNTVDLTALLGSFGASVTIGTFGDLNYDGAVTTADLTIMLGSFGC